MLSMRYLIILVFCDSDINSNDSIILAMKNFKLRIEQKKEQPE